MNNFISKQLHGEAGDIDQVTISAENVCLQNVISNYNPEHIHNG